MLFILLFLKLTSWWWNIYFGLNLLDVAYVTIFKTDVMMMKYILRVEPSLMFDINKDREWRQESEPPNWTAKMRKKGANQKEKSSSEEVIITSEIRLPKYFQELILFSLQLLNTLCKLWDTKYRITLCIIVNLLLLGVIQLLKQTWFLPVRRDSLTKGSSAN